MNIRAMCVNRNYPAFNIEKSLLLGKLSGYGAPNDRVICPSCHQFMRTTQTLAVDAKRRSAQAIISRRGALKGNRGVFAALSNPRIAN
jgi:hypothetical protein